MTPETTMKQEKAASPLRECGESTNETTKLLARDLLERVGDKWTLLVVRALDDGPLRFTSLQSSVSGISHRMLTRTLRLLERDGLVTRTVYAEVPPRVEYELTDLGRTLTEPVHGFFLWVARHQDEVERSRARFDA